MHGSIQLRCQCKHIYTDHSVHTQHSCRKCGCAAFDSPQSCVCGYRLSHHSTLFETREERIASGKSVDNLGGDNTTALYAALGMWYIELHYTT